MEFSELICNCRIIKMKLGQGVRGVNKKDAKKFSQALMVGALAAVFLAAFGYLGRDIWLASTQWLLVAAVLGLFGLYLK